MLFVPYVVHPADQTNNLEIAMNLQRFVANATCVGALLFGVAAAQAAPVVWDWSPSATGGTVTSDYWTNRTNLSGSQYFGERVQFASSTVVSGIDIYMGTAYGAVGNAVKVSIWADAGGGVPGALLDTVSTLVTEVDLDGAVAGNHRVHADFSGFTMLGGSGYLIGMAGDGITLTQTGLSGVAGGDGQVARFGDAGFVVMADDVQDMAFRLYGSPANAVPEPGTLALLGLGLVGLVTSRRRQQ